MSTSKTYKLIENTKLRYEEKTKYLNESVPEEFPKIIVLSLLWLRVHENDRVYVSHANELS